MGRGLAVHAKRIDELFHALEQLLLGADKAAALDLAMALYRQRGWTAAVHFKGERGARYGAHLHVAAPARAPPFELPGHLAGVRRVASGCAVREGHLVVPGRLFLGRGRGPTVRHRSLLATVLLPLYSLLYITVEVFPFWIAPT